MKLTALLGILALAPAASGFTLVSPAVRARVVVGEGEPGYVFRAAQDLTNDVTRITGADLALTRGMAEFADAFDLYALGDTAGAAAAAQRGLAALEAAEVLDARYCRGKWTDWHKCRVQVPFPKIIEQARDLLTGLK